MCFRRVLGALWYGAALAALALFNPPSTQAQAKPAKKVDALEQHYEAARRFGLSGDNQRAAPEYRAFLGEAFRRIANAQANTGDFTSAYSFFKGAAVFAPNNPQVFMDWAATYMAERKLPDARDSLTKALDVNPDNASASKMMGRVLFEMGNYAEARKYLEKTMATAPDVETGYNLGVAYLMLKDDASASKLFAEMVKGFGDSAAIRLLFGRAYREASHWDDAIDQLKKAIATHPRATQVHYFLGLAYLGRDNDSGLPEAIPEFRAELDVNPDDYRTHYMLGYGLLKQHDPAGAEKELLRASAISPDKPDPLVYLAQLYSEAGRKQDAENAARKAIAMTKDDATNDYDISRAYYLLARVLLDTGRREEGLKELAKSEDLRGRRVQNQAARRNPADSASVAAQQGKSESVAPAVSPEVKAKAAAYIDQLKPAIGEAYNTLGVAAAGQKDFSSAITYFEQAVSWDPSLDKVDRNLGMAAFYGGAFNKAILPLQRELAKTPDDLRLRAALALAYFSLEKYAQTMQTLAPIAAQVDSDPGLSAAYGMCLIKAGKYDEGTARLKRLAAENPKSADVHVFLGSAYADQGIYAQAIEEYRSSLAIDPKQQRTHFLLGLALIRQGNLADAIPEMRTALDMNPNDVSAKYHLAFSLVQTGEKTEGMTLLQQVIAQDNKHADAYYQIGKLQLEQGDVKTAIGSLETATRLSPNSEYMHYQLAQAYRRDARTEDAARELKVYQDLKDNRRGSHEQPQVN